MNRYAYYSLIHHGMKSMLNDRMGHYSEPEFHQYLNLMIGKDSCSAMSDEELISAVDNLRSEGYLEEYKSLIPY
ncbi:hypothetical protein [Vibrio panuliri]|uniref:Mu-like prophage protein gp16 n=1 Tax=Vibrio panuliri TaxID=1381081 RepID=A0A1Q9HEJ3_9VIBR|nr:hypothetical protein [Vibrio panuliri]KAB1454705.1 hypothetical protein F7O85_17765 [Vibrio panuliri]OLQ88136.1 hypothetical protein BIY22_08170 [Vibrio panuliri]OLQ96016.1 hypothetical protein BIY20_05460 [Vibrio panuliri]